MGQRRVTGGNADGSQLIHKMQPMTGAMHAKVCLVTGATRGLGQHTALNLVRAGARVIVVGRSQTRLDQTLALLSTEAAREAARGGESTGTGSAEGFCADLSSMAEVRRLAAFVMERYQRLDVLVNNVGASLMQYQTSPDGYEMSLALNYLGHFLLAHELLDLLKTTAGFAGEARVVEITSVMCRYAGPAFRKLQGRRWYNGVAAYAQTKLALNMFAIELTRRLSGTGVTINSNMPGYVRTDISNNMRGIIKLAFEVVNLRALNLDEGAAPIVWMACAPELRGVSGRYYYRYQLQRPGRGWTDARNLAHLWDISASMTGL